MQLEQVLKSYRSKKFSTFYNHKLVMIELKPYVDVFRVNDPANNEIFNLRVAVLSSHPVTGGIAWHEEFENVPDGNHFSAQLSISVDTSQSLSDPQIFEFEIGTVEIGFSATSPLLKVSLYNVNGGGHLGSSTTHQDDIEEEDMPIGK